MFGKLWFALFLVSATSRRKANKPAKQTEADTLQDLEVAYALAETEVTQPVLRSALRGGKRIAARHRGAARQRQGSLGYAEALYTIGAPGTAATPLTNARHASGCFQGLRVYSQTQFKHIVSTRTKSDPVTWGFNAVYKHAMVPSFALMGEKEYMGDLNKEIQPCSAENSGLPKADFTPDHGMHSSDWYMSSVAAHSQRSKSYSRLAKMIKVMQQCWYNTTTLADQADKLGMRLVGRAMAKKDAKGIFEDIAWNDVSLVQWPAASTECYLVWRGVDANKDYRDVLIPKKLTLRPGTDFCGFQKVHHGFTDKFRILTQSREFKVQILQNLPKCSKVSSLGHSLGGALSELWAACVNRAPKGDGDYRAISWTRGRPQVMRQMDPQAAADADAESK